MKQNIPGHGVSISPLRAKRDREKTVKEEGTHHSSLRKKLGHGVEDLNDQENKMSLSPLGNINLKDKKFKLSFFF